MGSSSEHFSSTELECRRCWSEDHWHNNFATPELVSMLEQYRAQVRLVIPDALVVITDACRCAKHNATTPNGAKRSQHVQGTAADIWIMRLSQLGVLAMTPAEMADTAMKCSMVHGLGRNDFKKFIHIDTRPEAPMVVVKWCYSESGVDEPWYDPTVLA